MKVRGLRSIFALAAALVVTASLSFAGSWFGKSTTKDFHMMLDQPATVDGTMLPAGRYTMKIPENSQSPEVEFYAKGKLVAKAQATVKTESHKNEYTAVEMSKGRNSEVVTAVDPRGWSEQLVFAGGKYGS